MSLGHCHSLGEVYFAPELADTIPTKGARTFSHRLTPSYRALYARGSIFLLVLIREGRKSVPLLVLYLMWL